MPGKCARCTKAVYFSEEKIAIGKSFHVTCFVCANKACNRRLDSNNLTEHDDDIYCRSCYGKLFGPKGYGYGGGAGVLSMDTMDGSITTSNIPATAQAFMSPKLSPTMTKASSPTLSSSSSSNGSTGSLDRNGNQLLNNLKTSNFNPSKWGGADTCGRCGKAVYMAEKMMGGGGAWHKITCFSCRECNKRLESTTLCEREGEIYCKTCYGKQWGPKGYGFGLSAGVLQPNEAATTS